MKHNLKILNVLPLTIFFFIILSSGIVLYQLKVDKRFERSLASQLIGKKIPETLIPKENLEDLEKMRRDGLSPEDDTFEVVCVDHIDQVLEHALYD